MPPPSHTHTRTLSCPAPAPSAGLGEPTIRDLNDEINKLFREKYHWERRIVELGGPDYTKAAHGVSSDGMELPGRRGYKYFGAARTLPGVRELFEEAAAAPVKASAAALTARVDPAYFGYCDQHEVERLEQAEAVAEAEARARAREQWRASRPAAAEPSQEAAEADGNLSAAMATGRAFVHVPAHADVQEALLQKKRAELLARFT